MGLFKADFFRFFAIGFALGGVLTFASIEGSTYSDLANGVVPPAIAAPAR